jgi:hypothetical protein
MNSLEQTTTSGFNIFTSIQNDNNQDLFAQFSQQMSEKDVLISQLQAQIDELQSRDVTPDQPKDDEKKQKAEIQRLKKLCKDREKDALKAKSDNAVLAQKSQ